jgi:aminopeptidase N
VQLDDAFISALAHVLQDDSLAPAFRAQIATLPSEIYVAQHLHPIDPEALHYAREFVRATLAQSLEKIWLHLYQHHQTPGHYSPDAISTGKRALKNLALSMLAETRLPQWHELAAQQFRQANNMTDRLAALHALINTQAAQGPSALTEFYVRYQQHALALNKWFRLQATRKPHGADESMVTIVESLMAHPDFSIHNPNRARSLLHSFCIANMAGFHRTDGSGYQFWQANVLALDAINPQVAATLARALDRWRAFAEPWRNMMRDTLCQVANMQLSKNTREVIEKALADT